MNTKTLKFASAFLATSLLITPISGIIYQNDNVTRAENKRESKKIKEIITVKDSDILNILEEKYNNNELSERDFNLIKSSFEYRWIGPKGQTKVVVFWDGAFDLYLNSYYSYGLVGVSYAGATALLTAALAAAGVTGGTSLFGVNAVTATLSLIAGAEVSNGVIIYFRKINQGLPAWSGVNYYPAQIRSQ